MLRKFSVKNYRGFKDKLTFDLTSIGGYEFSTNVIRNGLVKNGIIYGKNGSGKSNLALAIFDLLNHLSVGVTLNKDYYANFVNGERPSSPVEFEYSFLFGNTIIDYKYSKDRRGKLIKEELCVNDNLMLRVDGESVFVDRDIEGYSVIEKTFSQNNGNVSLIRYLAVSVPLNEEHYIRKMIDFSNKMLWCKNLDVRDYIGLIHDNYIVGNYIVKENLIDDFSLFLKETSEQRLKLKASEDGERLICQLGKLNMPFESIASTGTKSLALIYVWLHNINKHGASFVFIDEFDAFFHHELSLAVCEWFFKSDVQIMLSTHNSALADNDLSRPDCFFLLKDGKIKSFRESTSKELRYGHNIEKIYRGGGFD